MPKTCIAKYDYICGNLSSMQFGQFLLEIRVLYIHTIHCSHVPPIAREKVRAQKQPDKSHKYSCILYFMKKQ